MSSSEWYENEAFWLETGPALFTEERWKLAGTEVDQLTALVKLPDGASVLDLGCGVGRHSLELARRGFKVTGVDRTATYLAQAKEKSDRDKLQIEWIQADMRQFHRDGAFDLVVNLLTSFGYFKDPAEDLRVIENVHASLKPSGQLVMELMGKEILARIFKPSDWHRQSDGTLLLEEREVAEDWSRLKVRWIIIKNQKRDASSELVSRYEHQFELRLYSANELEQLLNTVGFAEVCVYGSLEGKPYNHEAERLVMVARK